MKPAMNRKYAPAPKAQQCAERTLDPLPPDPEDMNEDRASWASVAVDAFMDETKTDPCDAISDLLCNLMHLCDRDGDYQRFPDALRRAIANYEEETTEPEDE